VKVPIHFSIFGQVEDRAYWESCLELMDRMPKNVLTTYHGCVPHEQVSEILSGHDLFFLPTRGENFGHAIVESLLAGVPVLISDATPWRQLAEKHVGWDVPLRNMNEFAEKIEIMYDMVHEHIYSMRSSSIQYALSLSKDALIVSKNRGLFLE